MLGHNKLNYCPITYFCNSSWDKFFLCSRDKWNILWRVEAWNSWFPDFQNTRPSFW